MNSIETIICLMLLLMAVPDLCRKIGRPALANVLFVVFGLGLVPLVQTDVATMVKLAGIAVTVYLISRFLGQKSAGWVCQR